MRHFAVVDLGYGDSGKGILTARIVRQLFELGQTPLVVKSNGGPQCAHNVIDRKGAIGPTRHHTFGQFGSGTFDEAETLLGSRFLVEPTALLREARELERLGVARPLDLMYVDEECLVITPYHWALNQWKEDQRGDKRHGSTGYGINETVTYALETDIAPRMKHLRDKDSLGSKLKALEQYYCVKTGREAPFNWQDITDEYYQAAEKINIVSFDEITELLTDATVVFESGQGVLLDEDKGFFPHVTRSYTTDVNARAFMEEHLPEDELHVVGVMRNYTTRHGAGPFVTEDPSLADVLPEAHNGEGHYQGGWRVGHLDLVAIKYAIDIVKPDSLYITHTDNSTLRVKVCTGYYVGEDTSYVLPLDDDPLNFARRTRHTEMMRSGAVKPKYDKRKGWNADNIADHLGVQLFGIGMGPEISQGRFNHTAFFKSVVTPRTGFKPTINPMYDPIIQDFNLTNQLFNGNYFIDTNTSYIKNITTTH